MMEFDVIVSLPVPHVMVSFPVPPLTLTGGIKTVTVVIPDVSMPEPVVAIPLMVEKLWLCNHVIAAVEKWATCAGVNASSCPPFTVVSFANCKLVNATTVSVVIFEMAAVVNPLSDVALIALNWFEDRVAIPFNTVNCAGCNAAICVVVNAGSCVEDNPAI